jgi:hypothetical protein
MPKSNDSNTKVKVNKTKSCPPVKREIEKKNNKNKTKKNDTNSAPVSLAERVVLEIFVNATGDYAEELDRLREEGTLTKAEEKKPFSMGTFDIRRRFDDLAELFCQDLLEIADSSYGFLDDEECSLADPETEKTLTKALDRLVKRKALKQYMGNYRMGDESAFGKCYEDRK